MQMHYNNTEVIMAKTEQIQVRIEPEIKLAAEAVFAKLGIMPSEAVRMFYHQVDLCQAIPFELKLPNAETLAAIRDIEDGRDLLQHSSLDSFKASLED